MPRVIGIDIPGNKRIVISLTYIYGVGNTLAPKILAQLGIDPNMKAHNISDEDIVKLNSTLQSEYTVEGDLRRQVQNNIKRLISISSYRGLRHRSGLPTRGQHTKCNARTRKGKKKTVTGKKAAK